MGKHQSLRHSPTRPSITRGEENDRIEGLEEHRV